MPRFAKALEFASSPAAASTTKRTALIAKTIVRTFLCLARRTLISSALVSQHASIKKIYQFQFDTETYRRNICIPASARVDSTGKNHTV
jgi:hypothetical protein